MAVVTDAKRDREREAEPRLVVPEATRECWRNHSGVAECEALPGAEWSVPVDTTGGRDIFIP